MLAARKHASVFCLSTPPLTPAMNNQFHPSSCSCSPGISPTSTSSGPQDSFPPSPISPFLSLLQKANDTSTFLNSQFSELSESLYAPTTLSALQSEYALTFEKVPYTPICDKSGCECTDKKLNKCEKIHFDALIAANTDISLGDCSYLNTCFKGKNCRYVHYHISLPPSLIERTNKTQQPRTLENSVKSIETVRTADFVPRERLAKKQVSFYHYDYYDIWLELMKSLTTTRPLFQLLGNSY